MKYLHAYIFTCLHTCICTYNYIGTLCWRNACFFVFFTFLFNVMLSHLIWSFLEFTFSVATPQPHPSVHHKRQPKTGSPGCQSVKNQLRGNETNTCKNFVAVQFNQKNPNVCRWRIIKRRSVTSKHFFFFSLLFPAVGLSPRMFCWSVSRLRGLPTWEVTALNAPTGGWLEDDFGLTGIMTLVLVWGEGMISRNHHAMFRSSQHIRNEVCILGKWQNN